MMSLRAGSLLSTAAVVAVIAPLLLNGTGSQGLQVQQAMGPPERQPTVKRDPGDEMNSCSRRAHRLVYQQRFHEGAGREWAPTSVALAPSGERFLGRLVNRSAVLTLTGLPKHSAVRISFDLYVIMSWDGSHSTDGPDIVTVSAGSKLARATFSNDGPPHDDAYRQTYPGPLSGRILRPGLTGADALSTLGYPDVSVYGGVGDATYRIERTLPHRKATLKVRITSNNTVDPGPNPIELDESFGVDNVTVRLLHRACLH